MIVQSRISVGSYTHGGSGSNAVVSGTPPKQEYDNDEAWLLPFGNNRKNC